MTGRVGGDGLAASVIGCERDRSDQVLPVAAIQRQIVAHEATLDPGPVYSLLAGAVLRGPVDPERLNTAFSSLVDAQPALRVRMAITGEGLTQMITPGGRSAPGLEVHDVAVGDSSAPARDFARRRIDVFAGPPIRLGLFVERSTPESPQRSLLVLALHHAFGDGQSLVALCGQLGAGYIDPDRRFDRGRAPARRVSVDEYRRQIIAADEAATGEAAMGISGPAPFRSGHGGIRVERLGRRRTDLLRERAQAARVTPFSVALAAFALALRKRSGGKEMELSVPVTTRADLAAFDLVGPLIRTVRVRVRASGPRVQDLLDEVQGAVLRAGFGATGVSAGGEDAWTLENGLSFSADVEPAQYLELPGIEVEPVLLHSGTSVFGLTGTLETTRGGESRIRLEAAEETMGEAEMRGLMADILAAIDGLVEPALDGEVAL